MSRLSDYIKAEQLVVEALKLIDCHRHTRGSKSTADCLETAQRHIHLLQTEAELAQRMPHEPAEP